MRELVAKKVPIDKKTIGTDDAIALFSQYGMKDKEKLFHYRRASKVNIYDMGGFEDYYYGYMIRNTAINTMTEIEESFFWKRLSE